MSTDLTVQEQQPVALATDQLRMIAATEFVPQALRGNLPAIMACVATGRALGIDDMSALRLIHLVNGRPTFSAELMVQLVRRAGHSIVGTFGDGACTVKGRRCDNGDEMEVTWTMAMAQRAGLATKATWRSYPESLLWARAVSQLSRMLFADVFAGGTYTPDEIPAEFEELEEGERLISPAQLTRLHTIASNHGVPKEEAKKLVQIWGDVESSKLLTRDRYEAVCEALERWEGSGPEPSGVALQSPAADAQVVTGQDAAVSASGPDGSPVSHAPAEEGAFSDPALPGADGGVPGSGETAGAVTPTPADSPDDDIPFGPFDEPLPFEDPPAELDVEAIAALHPPGGKRKGDTLGQIVDECLGGDVEARQWLTFALRFEPWQGTEFGAALRAYLGVRVPLLVELAEEGRA